MTTRIVIPDVELTWMGSWSASTSYLPNSVVERNGSSYSTKVSSTGQDPLLGAPWELVAAKGDIGPQGPPGTPGEGLPNFVMDFAISSFDAQGWLTIPHNLGYMPAGFLIEDSGGNEAVGEVEHVDINNLRVRFKGFTFSGRAIVS